MKTETKGLKPKTLFNIQYPVPPCGIPQSGRISNVQVLTA